MLLQDTATNKHVDSWLNLSYLFSVAGAAVVADFSALSQPARNIKVIKAVAISNLFFIIVFFLNLKLIHIAFEKLNFHDANTRVIFIGNKTAVIEWHWIICI
jgi:hypothetical protein